MLKPYLVAMFIIGTTNFVSATEYSPVVYCEARTVVLDEILSSGTRIGYQLVVHGPKAFRVAEQIPGRLYDNNQTFVRDLPVDRFFNGEEPRESNPSTYVALNNGNLVVFVTFSNVDGGRRSGNWIFRKCERI